MIASSIFVVLFPLFELGCYALLFHKRSELFFVKSNEGAILVTSLAGWLAYFTLVASTLNSIPCGVIYVASSLVAPLSIGPQLIRALLLRAKFQLSKLEIEEEISSREQRKCRGGLSTIHSGSEYRSGDANRSTTPSNLVAASQEKKQQSCIAINRTRSAVSAIKWALGVLLPILLILAWCVSSTEIENSLLSTKFEDCKAVPLYFSYAKLLFDIVSLILASTAIVIVRKIDDELYLNREITETSVLFVVTSMIIVSIRLVGHMGIQPILQTTQQMIIMSSMIIIPCCCPEIKAIENIHLWFKKRINPASKSAVPGYAQPLPLHRGSTVRSSIQLHHKSLIKTQENNRLTIETNTSWDAGLCILLSSEDGINAFTRHCAREFSSENILFWCAVNEYRAKFDDNKTTTTITIGDENEHSNERQAGAAGNEARELSIADEAREIYNRFIDNTSSTQVNLSSKQKNDIKSAIDSRNLTRETFDVAQKEIFSVMSRDSYPRFLNSKKNRRPL